MDFILDLAGDEHLRVKNLKPVVPDLFLVVLSSFRICNPELRKIRICNPKKKDRITNPDFTKQRIANPLRLFRCDGKR